MFHHVARASGRRLLFHTWYEGVVLWRAILRVAPQPIALCVMPNHVHLLHARDLSGPLGRALGGYARFHNRSRGNRGSLFEVPPAPEPVVGRTKQRRVHRYVLLNPCRAGLVSAPLDWPLSTYLDDLGLAVPAVRRPVPDPLAHHAYVARDDRVEWCELPVAGVGACVADRVLRAVSAVSRTPLCGLGQHRGPARQLALRSLRSICPMSAREAAAQLGVSKATAARAWSSAGVFPVARLAFDPECQGLDDDALRRMLRRSVYAQLLSG